MHYSRLQQIELSNKIKNKTTQLINLKTLSIMNLDLLENEKILLEYKSIMFTTHRIRKEDG